MNTNGNGPDTRLGDELGRALHQRADQIHGAPLSFDNVRGRAGRIQRNRRLASAAAVAAAVAIIVPVGIFAGQGLNQSATIPPASQGPSESPNPSTAPQPDPGPHQLSVDADQGPAAQVPYLDGTTLVRPDGSTLELPQEYGAFHLVGDELVGFDFADGSVQIVGPDGEVVRTVPGVTGLAGNENQAVWSTTDGALVGWTDSTDSLLATPGGEITVKAVTGDLRQADAIVYFDRGYGEKPMVTRNGEPAEPIADEAIVVTDVDAGSFVALRVSASDDGSCSGVYDPSAGEYRWETCDHSLSTFSPDGTHLLAPPAYRDGLGDGELSILDAAAGDLVTGFEIEGGFINSSVWEDSSHALVVTYDSRGWRILRVGLDGSIERVAGPVTSEDEMNNPFVLP